MPWLLAGLLSKPMTSNWPIVKLRPVTIASLKISVSPLCWGSSSIKCCKRTPSTGPPLLSYSMMTFSPPVLFPRCCLCQLWPHLQTKGSSSNFKGTPAPRSIWRTHTRLRPLWDWAHIRTITIPEKICWKPTGATKEPLPKGKCSPGTAALRTLLISPFTGLLQRQGSCEREGICSAQIPFWNCSRLKSMVPSSGWHFSKKTKNSEWRTC